MTKDEIVRNLRSCACQTWNELVFGEIEDERVFEVAVNTIHKLMEDKETLEEMLEQKYTKKQLVQAVNDIFEDTVTEDLNSTAQSVGAFLRLIDADGYMAIMPDGTVEIRLNEE